jgi:hypothetical protein
MKICIGLYILLHRLSRQDPYAGIKLTLNSYVLPWISFAYLRRIGQSADYTSRAYRRKRESDPAVWVAFNDDKKIYNLSGILNIKIIGKYINGKNIVLS